jgi:diketogulonate reductase-like aldo/keto reductase
MNFKEFGKTGRKLSALGIGTWDIGSDISKNVESIKYAIDNGINFIDTAEMYGTEPVVAKAIKGYRRSDLFIATKVWPDHFQHDSVIKACNDSLRKLETDYIDLYQLHWPSKTVPISETMNAMEELMDQGKIHYIGISNFSVEQTEDAMKTMKKYQIVSNQVEYSLVTRDIERSGIYDFCRKNKIAVIAYSPLSHGKIFTERKMVDELTRIGSSYGATASQMALAWLMNRDDIFPIPKATNKDHMKENIASAEIKIKPEDMEKMDAMESKYYKDSIASRHSTR